MTTDIVQLRNTEQLHFLVHIMSRTSVLHNALDIMCDHIFIDYVGLQALTEDVNVVLEEPFGGEEGMLFSSVLPCGSNFHLSTSIVQQLSFHC